MSVFGLRQWGWFWWGVRSGLGPGSGGWGGDIAVWAVSSDSLCRWHVQVSIVCLRCTCVQSCCTLSISASYHVFVYGRYRKSRLVCEWLSDLHLSRHHPLLWGAAPDIQRPTWPAFTKNGKSVSTQFTQQFVTAVTAQPLVGCVVFSRDGKVIFFRLGTVQGPYFVVGHRSFSTDAIILSLVVLSHCIWNSSMNTILSSVDCVYGVFSLSSSCFLFHLLNVYICLHL